MFHGYTKDKERTTGVQHDSSSSLCESSLYSCFNTSNKTPGRRPGFHVIAIQSLGSVLRGCLYHETNSVGSYWSLLFTQSAKIEDGSRTYNESITLVYSRQPSPTHLSLLSSFDPKYSRFSFLEVYKWQTFIQALNEDLEKLLFPPSRLSASGRATNFLFLINGIHHPRIISHIPSTAEKDPEAHEAASGRSGECSFLLNAMLRMDIISFYLIF